MAQKPIELHYWPTPNGHKITIMLEECGLPYEIKPVNIGRGDQFKPEFLALSPNNRMPAIVDSDGPGGKPISIFESGAILQYLGRKVGKFYPADERTRVASSELGQRRREPHLVRASQHGIRDGSAECALHDVLQLSVCELDIGGYRRREFHETEVGQLAQPCSAEHRLPHQCDHGHAHPE